MTECSTNDIALLMRMLQYRRPDGSETEKRFIDRYIRPLAPNHDGYGNFYVIIPKPDGTASKMLWSSHTDTVHQGGDFQATWYDPNDKCIKLEPKLTSSCLGADCGAGIYVMLKMIENKVPGLYIFHRKEETGGGGSNYMLKQVERNGAFFQGIEAAVAFDRRGRDSVITRMRGSVTCSDRFANSLIEQLEGYKIDTGGSFTDTGRYTGVISECTNVSVGFDREHTRDETLHVPTLVKLRDAMLRFDESRVVIARDPAAEAAARAAQREYPFRAPRGAYAPVDDVAYINREIITEGGGKRRATRYDVHRKAHTIQNLVADKSWAIARLIEHVMKLSYEDVIAMLVGMDESDRIAAQPRREVTEAQRAAFVEKHLPNIEKALIEQLNKQDPEPVNDDDEVSARQYLRGVNGLTDEEWRQLDAERSGRAPAGADPYAAWEPPTERTDPVPPVPYSASDPHGASFANPTRGVATPPCGGEEEAEEPTPSFH